MSSRHRFAIIAFFILFAAHAPAFAQTPPARFPVTGTVLDQTGGILPGAEVTLTGRLINQFRFLVGGDYAPTTSLSQNPRTVVQDAFTGGGAQNDGVDEERHFTLNDTSGINGMPANNFDLSGEWSRASSDQRHRFDMVGSLKPWSWMTLGINLSLRSGSPYTLTLGQDIYNTGNTNARPVGVSRNSLQGPGSARLDLRWSHEFPLKKSKEDSPKLTIGIDAFNVLNRVNYNGYVGNMQSPFFGRPTSAQAQRRLQLSLRVEM
jgi:hypothetical protein